MFPPAKEPLPIPIIVANSCIFYVYGCHYLVLVWCAFIFVVSY